MLKRELEKEAGMDVVDPATVKKMRSVSRPSTLKDVHADLCKHMDFTEIPRLASWALVEQMHPAWIQTPAQHVSMYLASAASIWLTRLRIVNQQNAIVSLSGTFTLSRIIIGMQSARVPEFTVPHIYNTDCILLWIAEIRNLAMCAGYPPQLLSGINTIMGTTEAQFLQLRVLHNEYNVSLQVTKTLFSQFIACRQADKLEDASEHKDLRKFGWMIFLAAFESNQSHQNSDLHCVLVFSVMFVASQAGVARNLGEVLDSMITETSRCAIQEFKRLNVHLTEPWTCQLAEVYNMFIQFSSEHERFNGLSGKFLGLLDQLKSNGCLASDDSVGPAPLWPDFKGALTDYLDGNIYRLGQQYAKLSNSNRTQLCWKRFNATIGNEMAATPRQFKTPMKSVMKTSMRKLYVGPSGSGISEKMKATPLSMMSQPMQTPMQSPHALQELRESLLSLIESKSENLTQNLVNFPLVNIPESVTLRLHTILKHFSIKYPSASVSWTYASKLYGHILSAILKQLPNTLWQQSLIEDRNFNRTVICLSLEIVRYTFESTRVLFRELLRQIECPLVDVCLLIDVITSLLSSWMPRLLKKRFCEIQERLLEADLFDDLAFTQFLSTRTSLHIQTKSMETGVNSMNCMPVSKVATETAKLHYLVSKRYLGAGQESPLCIYTRIQELCLMRLTVLCDSSGVDLDTREFANDIVDYVLGNEHNLKLICNRNIDIILLSSLFTSIRRFKAKLELDGEFAKVMKVYVAMPQYIQQNVTSIMLASPHTGTLYQFQPVFLRGIGAFLRGRDVVFENVVKLKSIFDGAGVVAGKPIAKIGANRKILFGKGSKPPTNLAKPTCGIVFPQNLPKAPWSED